MRLLKGLTRELVSNIIVLAVDMTDGPGTAAKGLPLNRGIPEEGHGGGCGGSPNCPA